MARCRDKEVFDTLVLAPRWVSLVLAVAVFAAGRLATQFFRFESPLLAGPKALVGLI